ncbi:hypothetical protein OSB04_007562 [Centaurea solstitialis]|uniref:Protein kinase domain-containing protein n=1 Tax=Centaurea solstitialis TaxID=347529 RepID=A0AA38WIL3_9ASTR|nr:hypothetical protein OSB04_007562 [Centaurea solstitialis]
MDGHWNLPDSYPDVKNKDYGEQIKPCWRPFSVRFFNSTEVWAAAAATGGKKGHAAAGNDGGGGRRSGVERRGGGTRSVVERWGKGRRSSGERRRTTVEEGGAATSNGGGGGRRETYAGGGGGRRETYAGGGGDITAEDEMQRFPYDSYVVFELIESDLYQVIRENDDLTPDHYQFFLYQLLRGLKYIHTSLPISSYLIICDFGHAQVSFSDAPSTIFWTSCRIMSQHDGIVLLNSVAPFFSKLCGGEASERVFSVPSDSMSSTLMIPASWDRLRTPPVDTSPHDLHISYRMNLREKAWDHVRSAILGEKCDKLVASHGVVSHLEACDGWHCLSSDQDTLEDIY